MYSLIANHLIDLISKSEWQERVHHEIIRTVETKAEKKRIKGKRERARNDQQEMV